MNKFGRSIKKKLPEIAIGAGIVGLVVSVPLAIKATPVAIQKIEERKMELNEERRIEAAELGCENYAVITKLGPIETLKVTWKCYIWTALVMGGSFTSIILGLRQRNKLIKADISALTNMLTTKSSQLQKFKEQVVEELGEEKATAIETAVQQEVAREIIASPEIDISNVPVVGSGDVLFMEPLTGRIFKSNWTYLEGVANTLDRRFRREVELNMNDYLMELSLQPVDIIGDKIGWTSGKQNEIAFTKQSVAAPDGLHTCWLLGFIENPEPLNYHIYGDY